MIKIVFCDDDDLTRKMMGIIFRDLPYQLCFATNGADGLALIEQELPALVVTDMKMDGMDGIALCKNMKARPHLADIPVILVSGGSDDPLLADPLVQDLFVARVLKPFSTSELRTVVKDILDKNR